MNWKLLFALLIAFAVLFTGNANALGITPGRTSLDYSPGSHSLQITIINSDHKELNLVIFAQGELNGSILIPESRIRMSPEEYEKKIDIQVNLPEGIQPGMREGEIVVVESPANLQGGAASLGAALAVASQVRVFSPYPGKYIEADLKVSGSSENKRFIVEMKSRGQESISKAEAEIKIYDSSGKEVKSLKSNSMPLAIGDKKELIAEWKVDAPLGRYNAKAVLNYDGQEVLLEKQFEVGEYLLELLQLYVKDFKLGGIAKFNALVLNKWSEAISNAYLEMKVMNNQFEEIADVKSATYNIPDGQKTTMVYYWDTAEVIEGMYNANIIMYYGDKKTQQDLKLKVGKDSLEVIGLGYVISEDQGGSGGMTKMLIIIIGFLALLNILWFFVLRKRKLKGR